MLLTIDVGNTNITLGVYDGDTLGPRWRLATDHNRMADEYGILLINLFRHGGIEPAQIHGIALASVVPPLTGTFVDACEKYLGQRPFVIDAGVKTAFVRRECDRSVDVRRRGVAAGVGGAAGLLRAGAAGDARRPVGGVAL